MTQKHVFLTPEGLMKLEEELEIAKTVRRKEIATRIKTALDFGDLSENSEYDQAKNEQAQLEERIAKVETMLWNAKLIDEDEITTHVVSLGSKVVVNDMEYNEEMEDLIAGFAGAYPF